jgi:uncharacterized protein (DUF58 family)
MTRSGSGGTPEPLPVSSQMLERYRLRLRQRDRATVPGAHLIRQRGQSLEFREFRPYLPGDDIRHVDWRASARHHRQNELLIRTFEHEAQTRVVISIDTRATMRLPESASKLQLAMWFAEAIAYIAGRTGDAVALHALYGQPHRSVIELGASADRPRIRQAIRRLAAPEAAPRPAWTALERALPPGSVWLVLTDLYFEGDADVTALASRVREAQHGARWVVVVDFDSWACEIARVGRGLRRIDGPGGDIRERRVKVTDGLLDDVKERIDGRKRRFDRSAAAGGYDRLRWTWPGESRPAPAAVFREHFFGQEIVRRLVMTDRLR